MLTKIVDIYKNQHKIDINHVFPVSKVSVHHIINSKNKCALTLKTLCPFLRMGFNCLKAREPL